MTEGVVWSLVAALGFGLTQMCNRKSNQLVDAFRTAFGLLLALELALVARAALAGEIGLALTAPLSAVVMFATATFFHFVAGWTLLALSQQRIGVARTGALVSAAPPIGTLLAAWALGEDLTPVLLGGVLLAAIGVALISLSGRDRWHARWARPWLALTVATIWGATPLLIRNGLESFDHPVLGLTLGLGVAAVLFAVILTLAGVFSRGPVPGRATRWMALGGIAGAVAVSAQWISFALTTIAIALTVQQLSILVVVALVPMMFREPFERMNLRFAMGVTAVLAGSVIVVLTGR